MLISHQHFIDKVAFVNGIISGLALYPQLFTTIVHGSGEGISVVSFGLIFFNSIVWFLYALHRSLITLAITSVLNCIASASLVGIIFFI